MLAGQDQQLLLLTAGGRRESTLGKRLRYWSKLEGWLVGAGLPGLPAGNPGVRKFLVRLQEHVDAGCARTVPESYRKALHFFETAGNQHPHLRVADHPMVLAAVKDCEVQKVAGRGRHLKQAPHYFVKIVVSLEFMVADVAQRPYVRVLAWTRLVRLWAGLRFGDT